MVPARAGLSIRSEDADLEAATSCADARRSNPCEVKDCFSDYVANTAPEDFAPAAKKTLSASETACRATRGRGQIESQVAREAEEGILTSARQCMIGATDCVVKSCYAEYISRYNATGALRTVAQREVGQAEQRCRAEFTGIVPDGSYNARSDRGCGIAPQFGIRLIVKGREISWEHQFRGISYKWVGAIDEAGSIQAAVGNSTELVADGSYADSGRKIVMHYPQCDSGPITLSIIGRL